jgi:hypothetical protein
VYAIASSMETIRLRHRNPLPMATPPRRERGKRNAEAGDGTGKDKRVFTATKLHRGCPLVSFTDER